MTGRPTHPAAPTPTGQARARGLPPAGPRPAPAQPSGTAHAVVGCQTPRGQRDTRRELRLRISVFFDGTCNNRTNVDLGPSFHSDASYRGAKTNIALLEAAGLACPGPDVDEHVTVYVEGVGTTNRLGDTLRDMVTGKGSTGIQAKVEVAFQRVIAVVHDIARRRELKHVHLDSFGFSRGAAAARCFVWASLEDQGRTLRERLQQQGLVVGPVGLKFVGLFDTVASCGLNHDDDTRELHLDGLASAEKVLHLVAGDEHRANFRLTDIASAGRAGLQIVLPGAHADVGGGYTAAEQESQHVVFDLGVQQTTPHERQAVDREHQWLVDSGWYAPQELSVNHALGRITATRRAISTDYSKLPLHLMAGHGRRHGVHFSGAIEGTSSIPSQLAAINGRLTTPTLGPVERIDPLTRWLTHPDASQTPAWLAQLRHEYLHFSANCVAAGGAHVPAWSRGGPRLGRRERMIQPG